MTVLAKKDLKKMYPDIDDEQFTPNGIDLRLEKVMLPENISKSLFGIVNGEKLIPDLIEIPPLEGKYILNPGKKYFFNLGRVHIPEGYCQTYYLRSTIARAGGELYSSVGDAGYDGDIIVGFKVDGVASLVLEQGERVVQALTYVLSDNSDSYDGVYQNNQIYNEKLSDLINPEYEE